MKKFAVGLSMLHARHLGRKLADLCQRNRIEELALFGSALTDRFGNESDAYLLVTFRPDARVGFLALARVQNELEDLLGRRVDLVFEERVETGDPRFRAGECAGALCDLKRLHLLDIVEAAESIGRFVDGVDESAFLQSEMLQVSVYRPTAALSKSFPLDTRPRWSAGSLIKASR